MLVFIIILSQFILILFNAQMTLNNVDKSYLDRSNVEFLIDQVFMATGDPYWGLKPQIPTHFGLSLDNLSGMARYVLDPSKVTRISAPSTLPNPFEYISYSKVRELLGYTDEHFNIELLSPLNVSLNSPLQKNNNTHYELSVIVRNQDMLPMSNISVNFFTLDLLSGNIQLSYQAITGNDGVSKGYLINPDPNDPKSVFTGIIIAYNYPLWGYAYIPSYAYPAAQNAQPYNYLTGRQSGISPFFYWNTSSKTAVLSDTVSSADITIENHSISLIYATELLQPAWQTKTLTYSETELILSTSAKNIANTGLILVVWTVKTANEIHLRISSLPVIWDNNGNFVQSLGPNRDGITISPNLKSISVEQTVLLNNLPLIAKVTFWGN